MKNNIICLLLAMLAVVPAYADHTWTDDQDSQSTGGKVQYALISGTTYRLTAVPNTGYEFLYWMDNNSTDPVREYTVQAQRMHVNFRAVFGKTADLHQTLGNIHVSTALVESPKFWLTANPLACATLTAWSNDWSPLSAPVLYETADGNVVPTFHTLPMRHRDGETATGGHIEVIKGTCQVTLTAVANTGYQFVYWEDGSTNPVRVVEYDKDFDVTTYYATFASGIAVKDGIGYPTLAAAIAAEGDAPVSLFGDVAEDIQISKAVTLNANGHQIGDLTIANGGDLTLTSGLMVNDLYLSSTTSSSSQLRGEDQLTYEHAYVDITLDPSGTGNNKLWYAFAVPFTVDVNQGVRRASAPDEACTNEVNYAFCEYDGALRASSESNGWVRMSSGGELQPGRFYMMCIDDQTNIWRFAMKDGAELGGASSFAMSEFPSTCPHNGWNAMGNSTLTYASATTDNSIAYAQIYVNGAATARYEAIRFDESGFVMASPFFVQVAAADQLNFTPLASNADVHFYAPARGTAAPAEYYKVQLLQDGEQKDVIFLTTDEYALDEYETGKDVMKMMGGAANSYLYATAYGLKLCAQNCITENGEAVVTLGMEAAQAANYELNLAKSAEGTVYLTCNNIVIANLSDESYTLSLAQGANNGYGLLIRTASHVTTDWDRKQLPPDVMKYIHHNALYIRANGILYNAQGGKMK